jgi:hypothetical protein
MLPWIPAVGVLLALAPAWLSPMPPLRAADSAESADFAASAASTMTVGSTRGSGGSTEEHLSARDGS